MAKSVITNDTYDSRDAGHLNSAVQMILLWRCVSTIIPFDLMFRAYIRCSPLNIEDDWTSKVAQNTNEDIFYLEMNMNSSNEVFEDCELGIGIGS